MGSIKKISLRGSIADEIATLIQAAPDVDIAEIVDKYLFENSADLIQIRQSNTMLVGKKSEVGQYPPDW